MPRTAQEIYDDHSSWAKDVGARPFTPFDVLSDHPAVVGDRMAESEPANPTPAGEAANVATQPIADASPAEPVEAAPAETDEAAM